MSLGQVSESSLSQVSERIIPPPLPPWTSPNIFNQSQKLLYFHEKVLKNVCSKIPRIHPPPWFNVVPNLEKLRQAVMARNDQANLQPTLNKWAGRSSLTIFVTNCLQN